MGKAIQITDEAYRELVKGRQVAIDKAKERGDLDAAKMFEAMGVGSFAGYLVYKEIARLEKAMKFVCIVCKKPLDQHSEKQLEECARQQRKTSYR